MTLREYLDQHDLSPQRFGERIGVEGATVRRYLLGNRFPKPCVLEAIEKETKGQVTATDFVRQRTRRVRGECRAA